MRKRTLILWGLLPGGESKVIDSSQNAKALSDKLEALKKDELKSEFIEAGITDPVSGGRHGQYKLLKETKASK